MLIQKPSFASTYNFAIDPSTFKSNAYSAQVHFICLSTSRFRFFASAGLLTARDTTTLDGLKESENIYMDTMFKWNGSEMWSSTNKLLDEMEAWKKLNPIFVQSSGFKQFVDPDLSLVDGNYEGWYARK